MEGSRGGWDATTIRGWLDQGIDPGTIRDVVLEIGEKRRDRGTPVVSFRYFEKPIQAAHEDAVKSAKEPKIVGKDRVDMDKAWENHGHAVRDGWFLLDNSKHTDMVALGKCIRLIEPFTRPHLGLDIRPGFPSREAYEAAVGRYEAWQEVQKTLPPEPAWDPVRAAREAQEYRATYCRPLMDDQLESAI
jgi:hypothetical protein